MGSILGWLTGQDARDQQSEALDRQQAQVNQGYTTARTDQQTGFDQALKQLNLTQDQLMALYQQALQANNLGAAQAIAQAHAQAQQQAQGGLDTNKQILGNFAQQQAQQTAENAPQLAAKNQMLQTLQQRMLGLASGTGTFQPTALYNTQLGEMNKQLNNAFAARGLGNSSAAITGLREGQNKLMATDQQQQFTNVSDMYNKLMQGNFSAVQPQAINLQNPYANLTDVSRAMQQANVDHTGIYNNMAGATGSYGSNVSNLYSTQAANLSNLATGQGNSIGNIAKAYGNIPQAGLGTALTNAAGLISSVAGARTGWKQAWNS